MCWYFKSKANPPLSLTVVEVCCDALSLIVQLKLGHSKTGSARSKISIDWAVEGVILSLTLSLPSLLPHHPVWPSLSLCLSLICYMTQYLNCGFSSDHVSTHCVRRHLSSFCYPLWWHFKHFDSFFLVFCREPFHSMVIGFAFTCETEDVVIGGFKPPTVI